MENSEKLEWQEIEVNGGIESQPSSVPKQTILFDDYLLCFTEEPEICIFDLVNSEWSKITPDIPENFPLISKVHNSPIYVMDHSTLGVLSYDVSWIYIYSLIIDRAQVPWQMEWVQLSCSYPTKYPIRESYTALFYKGSVYIFGGKDRNNAIRNDLLILNSKESSTHLQAKAVPKLEKRYDHSSLIHNEELFIYGGIGENKVYLNDIWAWNLKNDFWKCIFSNESYAQGWIPAPRHLSFMQAHGNTLFFYRGKPENEYQTFISFDMETSSWENLTPNDELWYADTVHCFAIYNNKFIVGDDSNLYEASLFHEGSLKLSNNEGINDVANDFKQLFREKLFCDVTFKVEGEEVPAHKAILAGRSKYFKDMLTSKMSEAQSQIIEVTGVKKDVFKGLIEFLYCGDTNITEEIALDLLKLSDEYQLEKLKKKCETFLMYHIKLDSVIDIVNAADKHEAFDLRKAALKYILTNITKIKETVEISRLNKSVLWDLIDRDSD